MPHKYPAALRRQVIELARSGTKIAQLAATFGMSDATIYNWLKQERVDRGEVPGLSTEEALDLAAAKRRIKQLETELAVSRKVNEVFLEGGPPPKRLFPVIESLVGQGINVRHACRVLGVSESGYYDWKGRPAPPRTLRRIWLAGEIADVHKASGGTYVISRRYEHGSIILTTNRGIASWGEIFEDTTVAAAILDRLLHRASVLHIDGESYRMRGHREKLAVLREGVAGGGEIP